MKVLRSLVLALLFSLIVGMAIGTALRMWTLRPVRYIGSATPALPLDVAHAGAPVLDARHDEEQIG